MGDGEDGHTRLASWRAEEGGDIERFAREYATTQPSFLRPLIGLEHHRNGAMQIRIGFNINSGGVYTCSQWNVDDILVTGNICP